MAVFPEPPHFPPDDFASPGLPVDRANTTGREPLGDPQEIPDIADVDCPDELREKIEAAMARYPDRRSASIPALWAIQRHYGWCTPEGIRQAAAVMQFTPAYLESVASFYDLFFLEPAGRSQIRVCTNISCWMRGGDELLDAFCRATGVDRGDAGHGGGVSEDGQFFVSGFECLGACDLAPMASVDERYFGPLTGDDVTAIVEAVRKGEDPPSGRSLSERPLAGGQDPTDDPKVASLKGPNR
jgi:NADH:ubiquinone oxidoreductase subunit E